ncbi:hypothetical protein M0802_000792 [Mischocyttarus mexicanus]|nr:hypothetical protein M0802_000792 [Mischocyttarus mexicanus]
MNLTPLQSKEGPLGSIQVVQLGAVPRFKCPGIPQMVSTKVTSRDCVFPLEGTLGVRGESKEKGEQGKERTRELLRRLGSRACQLPFRGVTDVSASCCHC